VLLNINIWQVSLYHILPQNKYTTNGVVIKLSIGNGGYGTFDVAITNSSQFKFKM
jgi:hypothetical protein